MKTILSILITLLGLCAQAANPSFQQFNTNDFIVVDKVSVRVNTNVYLKINSTNAVTMVGDLQTGSTTLLLRHNAATGKSISVYDYVGIERFFVDASLPVFKGGWVQTSTIGGEEARLEDGDLTVADATIYGTLTASNAALHNPQLSGGAVATGADFLFGVRDASKHVRFRLTSGGYLNLAQTNDAALRVTAGALVVKAAGVIGFAPSSDENAEPDAWLSRATGGTVLANTNLIVGVGSSGSLTVLGTGGITNAGPLVMNQITVSNTLPPADSIKLFAFDVGGTAEMFVMDEAGNLTQLSPHAMTSPGIDSDTNALPVILHHRNVYSGEQEWIHISKLARAVEKLTGEQFIYSQPIPVNERRNWQQDQAAHQAAYDAERTRRLAEYNTPIVEILEPMGITNIISSVNTNIVVPPIRDVRQPAPEIISRRSR